MEHNNCNALRKDIDLTRISGLAVTLLKVKHDTCSVLTAPPTDHILRYQRAIVLFTALLAILCVDIWVRERA